MAQRELLHYILSPVETKKAIALASWHSSEKEEDNLEFV